jgi:ATPase subunit of ABC transporter with duplicated ATPase domains
MYEKVNLLILDEPTNHLDIESREVLEESLMSFEGSIFFVSHDRYFIEKLADKILWLEGGTICSYPFGYREFLEKDM